MYQSVSQDELAGFTAGINAITDNKYDVDSSYLLAHNASINNYEIYKPESGAMAWWIINGDGGYTVYTFTNGDFINGVIKAGEQLNKDFRDYILGAPYGFDEQGKRINYNVEGYDILPYTNKSRVSAPIGPFYTGSIEEDAYGVDWES
jgi:hypothetical protein